MNQISADKVWAAQKKRKRRAEKNFWDVRGGIVVRVPCRREGHPEYQPPEDTVYIEGQTGPNGYPSRKFFMHPDPLRHYEHGSEKGLTWKPTGAY